MCSHKSSYLNSSQKRNISISLFTAENADLLLKTDNLDHTLYMRIFEDQ